MPPPVQGLRESLSFTGSFVRLVLPCSPLHWFSSWQYTGIRVPLCHRLIHEHGFQIHSFYSGGTFSQVLKTKSKGFTRFSSCSELKYFLCSSLVPLYHHFNGFPSIFLYYIYYFVNIWFPKCQIDLICYEFIPSVLFKPVTLFSV